MLYYPTPRRNGPIVAAIVFFAFFLFFFVLSRLDRSNWFRAWYEWANPYVGMVMAAMIAWWALRKD